MYKDVRSAIYVVGLPKSHYMHVFGLITLLAAQASLSLAGTQTSLSLAGICAVDYYNVTAGGGSMLNNAGSGVGEPLNVIISGLSSTDVLTDDGIINYARSIGLWVHPPGFHPQFLNYRSSSTECFGIHLGDPQSANLGDGHGWVNQTIELRSDYGDADAGTCLESLIGGNHFRLVAHSIP